MFPDLSQHKHLPIGLVVQKPRSHECPGGGVHNFEYLENHLQGTVFAYVSVRVRDQDIMKNNIQTNVHSTLGQVCGRLGRRSFGILFGKSHYAQCWVKDRCTCFDVKDRPSDWSSMVGPKYHPYSKLYSCRYCTDPCWKDKQEDSVTRLLEHIAGLRRRDGKAARRSLL